MPEGDTIFRSAATLRKWIGGRVVTAARCDVAGIDLAPLVGRVVAAVTPVGKHLLMQFDQPDVDAPPLLLRTHMRMTGSWHVYADGAPWQRPARQARVVIQAGGRLAVCFNVPIVELTTESVSAARGVAHLGPDILGSGYDANEVAQRAFSQAPGVAMSASTVEPDFQVSRFAHIGPKSDMSTSGRGRAVNGGIGVEPEVEQPIGRGYAREHDVGIVFAGRAGTGRGRHGSCAIGNRRNRCWFLFGVPGLWERHHGHRGGRPACAQL